MLESTLVVFTGTESSDESFVWILQGHSFQTDVAQTLVWDNQLACFRGIPYVDVVPIYVFIVSSEVAIVI